MACSRRHLTGLGLASMLGACQSPAPRGEPSAGLDLYLLVGQSNMAGRGHVEPQDRQPDSRVRALSPQGDWREAVDPLHADRPAVAGVGPGRSFGLAMAEAAPGRRIGLVPCAVGGSSIRTWQPGAVFEIEPGRPLRPLDAALQRAAQAGPAGRWCGILWHQGESDSNEADAPLYEARLRQLLSGLRGALGDTQLPVLIGQMGRWPGKPWSAPKLQVDAAHQRVAQTLGHAAFVNADGLGLHEDGLQVHFDAAGARELGRRYALALQGLRIGVLSGVAPPQ